MEFRPFSMADVAAKAEDVANARINRRLSDLRLRETEKKIMKDEQLRNVFQDILKPLEPGMQGPPDSPIAAFARPETIQKIATVDPATAIAMVEEQSKRDFELKKAQMPGSYAPQVSTDWFPAGNGRYQLMRIDEIAGQHRPVVDENGRPVFATAEELIEAKGKVEPGDPYEKKFGSKFGEKSAERLSKLRESADDALSGMKVIDEAENLLSKGMFAGSAANIRRDFNKWLQETGMKVGEQKVANTEAFASMMGIQVGKIIKQFGSGTGLSDADREYAQKIVGGEIKLTEKSIRKLLDINRRIYKWNIINYNENVREEMTVREEVPRYLRTIDVPKSKGNSNTPAASQPTPKKVGRFEVEEE